jgi:hypothetical protein
MLQNVWFHLAQLKLIRDGGHCVCWDVGHYGARLLHFLPPSDYPSSELDGSRKLGAA